MLERARQKMMAAVNEATGRADCGEAVLLIQRPWWTYAVFIGIFLAMMTLFTALEFGAIFAGAIAGGIAGGALAGFGQNRILGYCDGTVVLVKSAPFSVKADGILAEWPYPVPAELKTGVLGHKATVGGEDYQLAKQLEDRFRAITGLPAAS